MHLFVPAHSTLLHLEDQCLFRVPDADVEPDRLHRALARLVAEALDSAQTVDGLCAPSRSPLLGISLLDALAAVVGAGGDVTIAPCDDARPPSVTQTADALRVVVARAWHPRRLVDYREPRGPCVGMHEDVDGAPTDAAFEMRVTACERMRDVPPLMAPADVAWRSVAATPALRLRVHRADDDDEEGRGWVCRYRQGVLWSADRAPGHPRVLVDAHHAAGAAPLPAVLRGAVADLIAHTLLHASTALALAATATGRGLLEDLCAPAVHLLRDRWRATDAQCLGLLRNATTPTCVARLLDADLLLEARARHERTELIAHTLLRRMQTEGCTREADWAATVASEFGVARVETLPVPPARFARLHADGVFDGLCTAVCEHGLLLDEGDARALVVPTGATPTSLTHAIAALLRCEVAVSEDARAAEIVLTAGDTHVEGSVSCAPDETLVLYRLRVRQTGEVVLERDTSDGVSSAHARSVDELPTLALHGSAARARRLDLDAAFPALVRRLSLADATLATCAREVQCRRVAREWTMADLDAGGNLSSLGLSVLLCVAMNGWLGYRVRVALSRTRAAMVGAWDGERWVLVDPTRTRCNLMEAADYLVRVPTPTTRVALRRNLLVEVRVGAKWQVGVVRRLEEARGQFTVDLLGSERQLVCALNAHTWRRVTDDSSDLDRVVTHLAKRPRVSVPHDDGTTGAG